MIIVDTGVLYALADHRDTHHQACARWLAAAPRPLIVPPLVIAETCYLIDQHLGATAEATFLDAFEPGQTLSLADFLAEYVTRMAVLVRQYADLKLGGTDAAVIATAERPGITRVATVDRHHFTVVNHRAPHPPELARLTIYLWTSVDTCHTAGVTALKHTITVTMTSAPRRVAGGAWTHSWTQLHDAVATNGHR